MISLLRSNIRSKNKTYQASVERKAQSYSALLKKVVDNGAACQTIAAWTDPSITNGHQKISVANKIVETRHPALCLGGRVWSVEQKMRRESDKESDTYDTGNEVLLATAHLFQHVPWQFSVCVSKKPNPSAKRSYGTRMYGGKNNRERSCLKSRGFI